MSTPRATQPPSSEHGRENGRARPLDGLRALALALVFAHHINQVTLPGSVVPVGVFFVLSGYLISHLLLREYDRNGRIDLRRFYARRALRLYPALVVMVLLVTPAATLLHVGKPAKDALASLLFLTDFWTNLAPHLSLVLHTWSLAVEEQFYLLWPAILIVALARGWPLRRLVCGLIATSAAVTITIAVTGAWHVPNITYLPTSRVAELGSGILLAIAVRAGAPRWMHHLSGTVPTMLALAALTGSEFLAPAWWLTLPLATVICWPIVAHLVLHADSRFATLLSRPTPTWLGRRSYGFYLWHYPAILILTHYGLHNWTEASIALPASLLLTVTSWRYVEQPFLALKARRFTTVATAQNTPEPTAQLA